MADEKNNSLENKADAEIWNAIAAFENILEVMPDDRPTLETLAHAYEHIGDKTKTLEYLVRLGDAIVADRDAEAADHILKKLENFRSARDDVKTVCDKLSALLQGGEQGSSSGSDSGKRFGKAPSGFKVADELSFAWMLLEAGELSQEEYASVAQDLSEMSANEHLSTVSVLHALHNRAYSGMERLMGYVAINSHTPIVSVQSFDVPAGLLKLLPVEFMVRRGVLVFGELGDDLLIVVMNPYDTALRDQVENRLGRKCHFFLTQPQEFDGMIGRAGELGDDAAA